MEQEVIVYVVSGVSVLIQAVIGYFLKQTMTRIDNLERDNRDLREHKAPAEDVKELRRDLAGKASTEDIKEVKASLAELSDKCAKKEELQDIKTAMNKMSCDMDYIKENTVRSDEFVRVMARFESKLDEIRSR